MKLPESFEQDLLALEPFADKLKTFLNVEKHFVEEGLVVSLTAPFGSGKSSFLQMFKNKMAEDGRTVISLNAWESDYYGDPLFSILSALIEQTPKDKTALIEDAAKRFGALLLNVGNQVLSATTGIDAQEAYESAQATTSISGNAFDNCRERQSALRELKKSLNEHFRQQSEPVLFLVDELDRCRPDYAISYLEVIKHIFDIENTAFVLAFDKKQLENSARHAFGMHLNFDEYLRKFIHREVPLPRTEKYHKIVLNYLEHYLEKQDIRRTSVQQKSGFQSHLTGLIEASSPTPRQLQDIFRQTAYVLQSSREEGISILWPYAVIASLLVVLKVVHPKVYDSISSSKMSLPEIVQFLKVFCRSNDIAWWFTLLISANAVVTRDYDTIKNYITEEFPEKERAKWIPQDINSFSREWGHYGTAENQLFEIKHVLDSLDILLK